MKTYKLKFLPAAKREWKKLDRSVKAQFEKALRKRRENPHMASDRVRGVPNAYRIKLRQSGYRLVYKVVDKELYILIIAVGKRNKNAVYNKMKTRHKTGKDMGVIEEKASVSLDVDEIVSAVEEAFTPADILGAIDKFADFFKKSLKAKVSKKGDFLKDDTEFGLKVKGKKAREKINAQVKEIVERVGKPEDLKPAEIELLKQYSGQGGTDNNSLFEYYTPTFIAEGMWDLLEENGFAGGNALEPSTGAGVFLATKKKGVVMTGTEIDSTSSKTASLLHPDDQVLNQPFEELAVDTPDDSFDSVIGNVPFGASRGQYRYKDPQYKNETKIELYFIHRAIDKVRPGGLVCLVCPTGVLTSKGRHISFRQAVSRKAEFLGAHKLPSKTFKDQGTNVVTDILVFKKHPRDLLTIIDNLPQETLYETRVYFEEFIQGKYWMGEGKKYIHGAYTPRIEGERFSREIVDGDIDNESLKKKLALKFKSRIDWEALEIAEELPKYYADGCRKHINGKLHELAAGSWLPVMETTGYTEMELDAEKYGAANPAELKGKLDSLEGALTLTLNQAYETYLAFPDLLSPIQKEAVETATKEGNKFGEEIYKGVLLGGMVGRLQYKTDEGDSEVDVYRKAVQDALTLHIDKDNLSTLPGNNKRLLKEAASSKAFSIFANAVKADGSFSDLVSGKLDKSKGPQYDPSNLQAIVEHLWFRIEKRPLLLPDVQALYLGELELRTVADIVHERNIAVYPDGRIEPMSSFVCGDIYPKIEALSEAMVSEGNPALKQKYQEEIEAISVRRKTTPIENVSFSFNQKWIPRKYIMEFLENSDLGKAEFSYGTELEVEEEDPSSGEMVKTKKWVEDIDDPFGEYIWGKGKSDRFLKQFVNHLNGHKVSSTVVKDKRTGEIVRDNRKEDLEKIKALTEQFQAFIEQHQDAMEIEELYNRKFNSYTPYDYSTEPLDLEGRISGEIVPHGYQAAAIRRLSDKGAGILGFGVGLGKTFTALGLYAYNDKMGRARRACIVVPNAVLANWYHESKLFLGRLDSFLMIGMSVVEGEDGEPKSEEILNEHGDPTGKFQHVLTEDDAETKQAKAHSIPQSNIKLVLMTKDFFKTIPMKPKNKESFINKKMEKGLFSKATAEKALKGGDDEGDEGGGKKKSYKEAAQEQKMGERYGKEVRQKEELPYFEDMGFDSVTVDEADEFKNSYEPTVDARGVAYMAVAPSSQRAIDMTMKMDYVKKTNNNRGPVLLTATPVSNSPLFEVYNMLSFVAPEEEFEKFNCYTVDDMLRCFGKIEKVDKLRITGETVSAQGLVGFQNLDGLRGIFNKYAEMKEAKDVGDFKLPPHEEVSEVVELNGEQSAAYDKLRELAKLAMKRQKPPGTPHVFTVIRDMEKVTADMDLYRNQMTFLFPADKKESVDAAVAKLPAQVMDAKEEWDAIKGKTIKYKTPVNLHEKLEKSLANDGQTYKIVVPMVYEEKLITALLKVKVPEDAVSHPLSPKYAKLVENTTREYQFNTNRGKQIIFTEEKTQHGKILRILRHHVPVENKYEVGIINADTAKGENLQKISDEYNRGAIRIVIANKKAEVGVNLQKGTNAIHHLTWPWNQRSLEQKNGRGLRQGNKAKRITIYYYKGKGSIDEYRLDLIIAKGNQTNELLKGDKHEAINTDAETNDDMEILLSDNPEEARRKKAEREAEAMKAEKARLGRVMTNNLRQMGYLAQDLEDFEETKERDFEELKAQIFKLTQTYNGLGATIRNYEADLKGATSEEYKKDLRERIKKTRNKQDTARRKQSSLENDLASFDARYEQTKKQKETRLATLRGTLKKKKDALPFDPAVLENPAKALVSVSGAVYEPGKIYECGDTSASQANTVVKITEIDVYARLFKFESFSGRLYIGESRHKGTPGWRGIEQFHRCQPKEVSYSEEELNLKKLLTEGVDYFELHKKLSEEVFEENKTNVRYLYGGALGRSDSGELVFILNQNLRLGDLEARKRQIVYPRPDNDDFRKECFELYLAMKRERSAGYDFQSLMEELFGSDYEARALEEGGATLPESGIREGLARIWDTELKDKYLKRIADGGNADSLTVDLINSLSAITDNPAHEIRPVAAEFATIKRELLEKEKLKLGEKREQERMEELKDHPDYKEVPENVRKAFEREGITVKVNTETIIARRYRYEPFKAWVLQDEDKQGGILRAVKATMKRQWNAKYMADEGKYRGSWWTIPSNVPLEDIFELIQATERPA